MQVASRIGRHQLLHEALRMKLRRAVGGGIIGAAAAFGVLLAGRWLRWLKGDTTVLLGGIPVYGVSGLARGGAFALQLLIGAMTALLYALVFEFVTGRAGWLLGSVLGAAHAALAGIVIGFLPLLLSQPAPETVPGAFLGSWGSFAALAFISAHLAYGLLVGAWYGATARGAAYRDTGVRWREVYPYGSRPA
jgi:hypothetical protein